MTATIDIADLNVNRGGRGVLRDITAAIDAGSVTGLLGPSGSGKTTLMRSIVGVQKITSGTVTVLGEPAGHRRLRHRIGYVTQNPSVYQDLTVYGNVRYFATLFGVGADETRAAIADVGLTAATDQYVGRLSGGQRARASLACALIARPELLILDEPTVGQDPVLRQDLWRHFHRLAAEGATLLVSSHVMDEAARCDRLLLIRQGRVVADDTPQRLRDLTGTADLEQAFLRIVLNLDQEERLVSVRITAATTWRILRQLTTDPRTIALILVVPTLLLVLLRYVMDSSPEVFNQVGLSMLGVFPFISMFLVTSVAMLRERTSGTLERILTTPVHKFDLILGYALAFTVAAIGQSLIATAVAYWLLDLSTAGAAWLVVVIAAANAVLGLALGLLVSAFANSEFQAVQFMPAVVLPQVLLCGLIWPRAEMVGWLQAVSDALPLTYAVEALAEVGRHSAPTGTLWQDLAIVAAAALAALILGAATLRRRTG